MTGSTADGTAEPAAHASMWGFGGVDHVDTWVFDLDNTVYPAECNLFTQVDQRMGEFISRHFNLAWDDARAMQKSYFRQHGTTLRGLMIEHGMSPEAFLDYVHDIDLSHVPRDPRLDAALDRLPGRKIIYTNGSVGHAENVLSHLGIGRHFDAVYDIIAAEYVPKPAPRPYREMISRFDIEPTTSCMVEDMARNLQPARALGMTTVWIRSEADWARPDPAHDPYIDHVVDDLAQWLGAVAAKRTAEAG